MPPIRRGADRPHFRIELRQIEFTEAGLARVDDFSPQFGVMDEGIDCLGHPWRVSGDWSFFGGRILRQPCSQASAPDSGADRSILASVESVSLAVPHIILFSLPRERLSQFD